MVLDVRRRSEAGCECLLLGKELDGRFRTGCMCLGQGYGRRVSIRAPTPTSAPRPLRRAVIHARAQDPGWERTRTSARALLAMVLGAGPGVALLAVASQSMVLAALGGIVAMLGTMTLAVADRPAMHIARLTAAAATTGALASALTPWTAVSYVAFIGVMAAGAWATRWGPSGTALAMVGFMAYFFALFSQASPGDVPWVVAVVVLGGVGAAVTGLVLLPERPAVTLPRLVSALLARASRAVDAAIAHVDQAGQGDRLRDRLAGVQEVALRIDGLLDDARARASVTDPDGLRSAVLATEGLADHLAWAVVTSTTELSQVERHDLAAQLRHARVPLDLGQATEDPARPLVPHLRGEGDERAVEVLARLAVAAEQVARAARPAPTGHDHPDTARPTRSREADDGTSPSEKDADDEDADAPRQPGLAPNLRKMVQVVLAGTLALVLGLQLSAAYWYWAVIGAFIVVLTTPSRGAGLRKALDRTIGTAIGVVVGLGLGTLLAGRASVELAVIAALLFAAFWILQANYLWMMTLISVMVALLYDVMGILTADVLTVRVTETALGAGLGGLVAFFVLPTPTRHTIDEAVDAVLAGLDNVLDAVADGRAELGATRPLDRAVATLRQTTAPLVTAAPTRTAADVRAARLLATSVRFRSHALVTAVAQHTHGPDSEVRAGVQAVRQTVEFLRHHLGDGSDGAPPPPRPFATGDGEVQEILRAINDRLEAYATSRRLELTAHDDMHDASPHDMRERT